MLSCCLTSHSVHKFQGGGGGQILAKEVNAPKLNEALIYVQTISYISCDCLLGNKVSDGACTVYSSQQYIVLNSSRRLQRLQAVYSASDFIQKLVAYI